MRNLRRSLVRFHSLTIKHLTKKQQLFESIMNLYEENEGDRNELREAVLEGKTLLVKMILEKKPQLLVKRDQDGRTPLHWAVSLGNKEATSEMLKAAKSIAKFDINEEDESGWTATHIAASTGNLDILEQLVPFNPDWDLQTKAGQAAIHFAVSKNHPDVVRFLLSKGASARIKDSLKRTGLHRAASIGSVPIIKILINAKCPIDSTDSSTWTALHHAMIEGHGDAALELISSGADIERRDGEGHTALELANSEQVRRFVETHIHK